MKNSEQPITPCMMQQVGENSFRANRYNDPKEYNKPMIGLTKREYFAAMAMQGLLVNYFSNGQYGNHVNYPMVSEIAIRCADEILAELEK